jgi:membrane fusion protein (multidrug efflux system)
MAGRKPDPAKRAQILRAATDVFSQREFHAVPVDDVAATAGVGKGTLYLYFPTKEQLFYATILEAMDVLIGELRTATRGVDGEAALRAFTVCMLDFFRRRRQLAVLMHRYEHRLREPAGVEWRARRSEVVAIARALIVRTAPLATRELALATDMLLALIRAAVLSEQDGAPPERAVAAVVRVFLHGRTGTTLALLVVGLVAAGCADHTTTATETAPAPDPVAVTVVPVSTAAVERVADVVGSFYANEEATVGSQLESRVVAYGPDMGDHVHAGDVLVRLDDADLQAQLREVEARLVKAHADDARARALRADGIMSHEEAERMVTDAAVLEAQRDLLKVKLDRTVIHAPLTGGVAARTVAVGEVVKVGQPLYKIVQDDPLKFRTPVPERFARFLRIGEELRLGVAAYPDRQFTARITRINPAAEEVNRSITVEAEVANAEGLIKPGFFGSGEVVYDEHAPALVVPESALTTFAGVTKLFVVKDGKAEERVVRTGVAVPGERREIANGVAEGEEVAVTNLDRLENGAAVTVARTEPVAHADEPAAHAGP